MFFQHNISQYLIFKDLNSSCLSGEELFPWNESPHLSRFYRDILSLKGEDDNEMTFLHSPARETCRFQKERDFLWKT